MIYNNSIWHNNLYKPQKYHTTSNKKVDIQVFPFFFLLLQSTKEYSRKQEKWKTEYKNKSDWLIKLLIQYDNPYVQLQIIYKH